MPTVRPVGAHDHADRSERVDRRMIVTIIPRPAETAPNRNRTLDGNRLLGAAESVGRQYATEEFADQRDDLACTVLQCEMARLDQVQFGVRIVAQIGCRARHWKNLVVFAPDDQDRWLVRPEEALKLRIH